LNGKLKLKQRNFWSRDTRKFHFQHDPGHSAWSLI